MTDTAPSPERSKVGVALLVVLVVFSALTIFGLTRSSVEEVAFSTYIGYLEEASVVRVVRDNTTGDIDFDLDDGRTFATQGPESPSNAELALLFEIPVSSDDPTSGVVFKTPPPENPLILLAFFFAPFALFFGLTGLTITLLVGLIIWIKRKST